MAVEHSAFVIHHILDDDGCIVTERTGIGECIENTAENRIDLRNRGIRAEQRHLGEVSCILNQLRSCAVIRMIITETV